MNHLLTKELKPLLVSHHFGFEGCLVQWHFPDTAKPPLQTAFASSPAYTEKLNFKGNFKSISKTQLKSSIGLHG